MLWLLCLLPYLLLLLLWKLPGQAVLLLLRQVAVLLLLVRCHPPAPLVCGWWRHLLQERLDLVIVLLWCGVCSTGAVVVLGVHKVCSRGISKRWVKDRQTGGGVVHGCAR